MTLLPSEHLPEPVRAVIRASGTHRRLLAAGCAAASVAFALSALRPAPPATATVLTATHDLAAGVALTGRDVVRVGWPRALVPAGAMRSGTDVVGRIVAAPVRKGEPLTDVRLVGSALFGSLPAGVVATPVRIGDPGAARLLQPGDIVDVLAASDRGAAFAPVVASGSRVLVVPAPGDSPAGLDDGALVVLATTPATAALLARAAANARLSVVIRGH